MSPVTQIHSEVELRRTLVRTTVGSDGKPVLNGMDFIEVATQDQTTLQVHFIHPLPGQANGVPSAPVSPLTTANLVITGGVRVTEIRVLRMTVSRSVITLVVDQPGGIWSAGTASTRPSSTIACCQSGRPTSPSSAAICGR